MFARDDLLDHAAFLHDVAPSLVGLLGVCGLVPADAASTIEGVVARSVTGGDVGGTALAGVLTHEVLEHARESEMPPEPDGPVETALRTLPFDDRLATASAAIGVAAPRGTARLDEVAAALHAPTDPWQATTDDPDVATRIRQAIEHRTPPPDPEAMTRIRTRARRRHRRLLVWFVVALLVAAAALLLISRTGDGDEADREPAGVLQWVAVLDTGPSAAALAGDARAIGEVAGPNVFTDRFGCYTGFPDGMDIDDDEWFLAVGDLDRAVVQDLVGRLGLTPLVVAHVDQGCSLPPPG